MMSVRVLELFHGRNDSERVFVARETSSRVLPDDAW